MKLEKIRGLIGTTYMFGVMSVAIVLFYLFPKRRRSVRRWVSKGFLFCTGIDAKMEGELDPDVQCIILNHQSFLDVIFLEAVHPSDLCWIAKKELGEIFFLGHGLKGPKMILIDREDKKGLLYLMKEVKNRLESNRVLAIFPEGTRSKDESKLLPFKSGAKLLVEKFSMKIQPIVILRSQKACDFGGIRITSTPARFIALPSRVPNPETDWYEELRKEMEECYLKELSSMQK